MFCRKCGQQIGDDSKFCPNCGSEQSTQNSFNQDVSNSDDIPKYCPSCNSIWEPVKENSGAGNTLGKAVLGGILLGPLGAIGGAAFGSQTIVYFCSKCGYQKEYKKNIVKNAAHGIKKIFE